MTDSESSSLSNNWRNPEGPGRSVTPSAPADLDDEPLRRSVATSAHIANDQDPRLLHHLDGHLIVRDGHFPFASGGFCDVYTGYHPIHGKVAMRRPRMTESGYTLGQMKDFFSESEIWKKLRHPNILQFLGFIQSDGYSWAVSRFEENGPLPAYLKHHPATDRVPLVHQLAGAIAYLHHQRVVHGDIKGSNILVSAAATVLLCDFGLSKPSGAVTRSALGGAASIRWCAPEQLFDEATKTCASDVYSFGMTVYEILSGNVPFHDITNDVHVMQAIEKGVRPPRQPLVSESGCSYEQLWNVASESWDGNPSNRPNMEVVCERFGVPVASDVGIAVEEISTTLHSLAATPGYAADDIEHMSNATILRHHAGRQRVTPNLPMSTSRRMERRMEDGPIQGRLFDERLILEMPRAHARYDDTATKPSRPCHPGTREPLLEAITNWIDDEDSNPLFWLCGEVGVGKTTIAHTIAKGQDALHQLGGSFFFNRDNEQRRHPALLATTIAYQLSRFDPEAYQAVAEMLRPDPDIVHRGLGEQVQKLVVQPLVCIGQSSGRKVVLVLDGLDECSDASSVLDVLPLLTQHTPLRLRILVTSRPHAAIVTKFENARLCHLTSQTHFRDIDHVTLDNDVRAFLEWSLADIASEYQNSVPSPWPSPKEIESLVNLASGLFVIASMYDRYTRDPVEANPAGQMKRILSRRRAVGGSPTAELDSLYDMVLNDVKQSLSEEDVELTRKVLQLVLLRGGGPFVDRVAVILDCDEDDVLSVLRRLGSVIFVPEPGGLITFFHASFGEYMQDPERCHVTEFLMEPEIQCHTEWAIKFLKFFLQEVEGRNAGLEYGIYSWTLLQTSIADDVSFHITTGVYPGPPELQEAKDRFCNGCAISLWLHILLYGDVLLYDHVKRSDLVEQIKIAGLETALQLGDNEKSLDRLLIRIFLGPIRHLSIPRFPVTSGLDETEPENVDQSELEAFKLELHDRPLWYDQDIFDPVERGVAPTLAALLWEWSQFEHPNILQLRGIDFESLQKAEKEVTVYFPLAKRYPDLKRDWYPALSYSFRQNAEEAVKIALEIAQSIQYAGELHPGWVRLVLQIRIEDIVLSKEGRPMVCPPFLRYRNIARSPSPVSKGSESLRELELTDWPPYSPGGYYTNSLSAAVWRFGCVLYEMITGSAPLNAYQDRMKTGEPHEAESGALISTKYFKVPSGPSLDRSAQAANFRRRYEAAVGCLLADVPVSDDLKGVLQACWVLDEKDRPPIQEIVARLTAILEALRNGDPGTMETDLEMDKDGEESYASGSDVEANGCV